MVPGGEGDRGKRGNLRTETCSDSPHPLPLSRRERGDGCSIFSRPDAGLDAAGKALDPQEAFGVGLVVRAAALHRGNALVVEAVGTGAAGHEEVALVQVQAHLAGDRLLRLGG